MNNEIVEKSNKVSILEKIKTNKKLQFIIIGICVILIVIIFIFSNFSAKSNNVASDSIDYYVQNLEDRLSKVLSKVKGAGKVAVVITVESGMETVLASKITTTENSLGKETEESPIVVNGKTVVVKELYPKIIGVLIVAEGASNISVMSKIQQATISLLDIEINQIEILSM